MFVNISVISVRILIQTKFKIVIYDTLFKVALTFDIQRFITQQILTLKNTIALRLSDEI